MDYIEHIPARPDRAVRMPERLSISLLGISSRAFYTTGNYLQRNNIPLKENRGQQCGTCLPHAYVYTGPEYNTGALYINQL